MLHTWQFRFAVHAGVTVVHPFGSLREPSAADCFPGAKFAIAGKKSVRVIYPVDGLESLNPEVIEAKKNEILSILKGPEKPPSNTLLNDIVRGLGLAGNWAAYKKECDEKLRPFLKDKGLKSHRSLLGREPDGIILLGYRQIADRLFAPGGNMPSRLFTGIGFDYWLLLELARLQQDLHVEMLFDEQMVGPFDKSLLIFTEN